MYRQIRVGLGIIFGTDIVLYCSKFSSMFFLLKSLTIFVQVENENTHPFIFRS